MSFMFEVFYKAPVDDAREQKIAAEIAQWKGKLIYREEPESGGATSAVCLTFVFGELSFAENASERVRQLGEHVEEIQPDYPEE